MCVRREVSRQWGAGVDITPVVVLAEVPGEGVLRA